MEVEEETEQSEWEEGKDDSEESVSSERPIDTALFTGPASVLLRFGEKMAKENPNSNNI